MAVLKFIPINFSQKTFKNVSSEPNGNVLKLFAALHYSELGSFPPGAGQRLKEESP